MLGRDTITETDVIFADSHEECVVVGTRWQFPLGALFHGGGLASE
jgi:hypothetical protein